MIKSRGMIEDRRTAEGGSVIKSRGLTEDSNATGGKA